MAEAADAAPKKTYHGNCQCGAVRFTLDHPDLVEHEVSSCNCSICTRNGYLLIYPPKDAFRFTQGEDKLTQYYFGTKTMAHHFCSVCGTSLTIVHPDHPIVAVNVRSFRDIDLDALKLSRFEGGKDLEPKYEI